MTILHFFSNSLSHSWTGRNEKISFSPDTDLVLLGDELRDVGCVAGLLVVSEALQGGLRDRRGDLVHLVNTAVASLSLHNTAGHVYPLRRGVHHHHRQLRRGEIRRLPPLERSTRNGKAQTEL